MSCHIYNNNILLRNCPFINISTIVTYTLIQKYIKYVKRTIEIELDACYCIILWLMGGNSVIY